MPLPQVGLVSPPFETVCVRAIHNLQNLFRNHHVYQLAVQPTWETTVVRKRLKGAPSDFLMELMDGMFLKKCVLR